MEEKKTTLGWGKIKGEGSEIWDTDPVFKNDKVELKDWFKLLFYPKKWFLYGFVRKHINRQLRATSPSRPLERGGDGQPSILDVGCGTGATLVDFKRMFGRKVKVVGVDVVHLQIDLAKEKIRQNGVWAEVLHYDGVNLPFADNSFDVVYTSDVLGHVENVPAWLKELNRVLKPNGILAMFTESKLGKHAWIRNYMYNRGLNVDPHEEFHISLYSKLGLRELLESSGFVIKKMYTTFWAKFFVHPDELYKKLQGQEKFFFLRIFNKILYKIKKRLHPYSTALAELYGLVEIMLVGKWVESQSYIVLAHKSEKEN